MVIFPRLRWLKCRLLRLMTIQTLLLIIFCCIVLEITRGFPVRKVKGSGKVGNDGTILKDTQIVEHNVDIQNMENGVELMKTARTLTKEAVQQDKNEVQVKSVELNTSDKKVVEWRLPEQQKDELIPVVKSMDPLLMVPKLKSKEPIFERFTEATTKELLYENRIIHFDLKGAAPKVSYLKEVLRLLKASGATGILLEWEDTFPFSGILAENRNSDAYTVEEVRDILETAQSLRLDIIPLVQTFGHLEWILKVEKFRQYRQQDLFPQVVCLTDEEGITLILEAIRQVIQFHLPFGIRYFHIGADEAFQIGECAKDRHWLTLNPQSRKEHLVAMHLAKIANYIKSMVPNVRVLAWHDMISSFDALMVRQYRLDHLLEIVVWDYSETLQQQNEFTWRSLAEKFPVVWGSSAYKGANEPSSQYLDLKHYVRNNKGWIKHRKLFGSLFRKFGGLILTGWQRYDHFAVLCEILPVGLPSAVMNLMIAKGNEGGSSSLLRETANALNCTSMISVDSVSSFSHCQFPGSELFYAIHVTLRERIKIVESEVFDHHQVKGWISRFNVRHNYTQAWYLLKMESIIVAHFHSMMDATRIIREAMEPIFQKHTIDEWIYEYVDPTTERLDELLKQIEQLKNLRTFPVRNFGIKRKIQGEL